MTNTKGLRAEVRAAAKHCASWHACATGDCPHENYLDCFDAVYIEGATSPDSPLLKRTIEALEHAEEALDMAGLICVQVESALKEIRECMGVGK